MSYIDAFVMPVITARLEDYRAIAAKTRALFLQHGALTYFEAMGDGLEWGKVTSFPRAVQLQEGEVAVIGFATYRDRDHRNAVAAKVMQDPFMTGGMDGAPMDGKRMIWGGFEVFA